MHDVGSADRLERWVAEQQVDEAVASRRREAALVEQAAEDGTLAGVLLDLAERERAVLVDTVTGRRQQGVVRTVGSDFIGLRTRGGDGVLVRIDAIAAVRPDPEAAPTIGDRVVRLQTGLAEVLGGLAPDRPRVVLRAVGADPVVGTLRTAGRDVVAVLVDGPDRRQVYVGLDAVAEVALL